MWAQSGQNLITARIEIITWYCSFDMLLSSPGCNIVIFFLPLSNFSFLSWCQSMATFFCFVASSVSSYRQSQGRELLFFFINAFLSVSLQFRRICRYFIPHPILVPIDHQHILPYDIWILLRPYLKAVTDRHWKVKATRSTKALIVGWR